ncbi:MAG: hypothetical protein ACYCZH_13640 [Sulfuriferula sp.]
MRFLLKAGFYFVCVQIALAMVWQADENTTGLSTVPRNESLLRTITTASTTINRASCQPPSTGTAIALVTAKAPTMTMQLSDKITIQFASTQALFEFFKAKTNRTRMVCVSLLFLEVKILKQRPW